jgi:zinc transporter 9
MASGSKRAVASAIAGNATVTAAKMIAFMVTGSAAMLSEGLHSAADTMNQVLLMVGITRSTRQPTSRFPFGFGAERAVWSLASGVGIFFLGCGVTVTHGVRTLLHPHPLEHLHVAIAVLFLSFVIEGTVLVIAVRAVQRDAAGKPFFTYLRKEADPTAAAVVMEDSAACLGVVLALIGILLSRLTGHAYWDSIASILIGLLLGAIAIWLITRSRHLLVGPAIPRDKRQRIVDILASRPMVEKVVNLRTRVMDTETYRVAADIEFDGENLADLLEEMLRREYPEISSYDDFRAFAARFADQVVEKLGDEIDAIEQQIQKEVPRARYLDIEAE